MPNRIDHPHVSFGEINAVDLAIKDHRAHLGPLSVIVEGIEVVRSRETFDSGLFDRTDAEVGVKGGADLHGRFSEVFHFQRDRESFAQVHVQGQLEGIGPSEVSIALEPKHEFDTLGRILAPDEVPETQTGKPVTGQILPAAEPRPTHGEAAADGFSLSKDGLIAHEKDGLLSGGSPLHDVGAKQRDGSGAAGMGYVEDGESGLQFAKGHAGRKVHVAGCPDCCERRGKMHRYSSPRHR